MKYTAGQAAKAVGVSTATITRALKSGKISGQKSEDGSWIIDPSELHRVFPLLQVKDRDTPNMQTHETPAEAKENTALSREVQVLREALADAREDRDKWREMAERLALAPPREFKKTNIFRRFFKLRGRDESV